MPRSGAPPATWLAAALAASAAAQWLLRSTAATSAGLGLAGASLALAIAAGRSAAPRASERPEPELLRPQPSLRPERPRLATLAVAGLAAVLALSALGRAPAACLALWLASVLAWNVAYGGARSERRVARLDVGLALGLLTLGLAARAIDLAGVPGGLYGDEAMFGVRARELLAGAPIAPFGSGFESHPALWTWLQAGAMALFGDGVAGLRTASAVASSLAVPALYTLLRQGLAPAPAAGGALVLALSPWNVHLGRLGLNEAWLVLCTVAALSALFAALRRGGAAAFVRAGSIAALCLYAGNKAVLVPPVLLGAGGVAWLALGGARRTGSRAPLPWRAALLFGTSAALVCAPQLVQLAAGSWHGMLASHPQRWLAAPEGAAAWGAQLGLVARTLLDQRDTSVFLAWPGMRIVAAGEAALFLVGVGAALAHPARPLGALLLGWLVGGLAPLVVDSEPTQLHHLVLSSALPAAMGALALAEAERLIARARARTAAGTAAALALACAVATQGAHSYFVRGARSWSYAETAALGQAMRELAPTHHLVLVTPPMSWDLNSNLRFLAPGIRARDKRVELDPTRSWLAPPGRDVAFLVDGRRAPLLTRIRARYPEASIEERRGPPARLRLAVVRVPAAAIERAEGALLRAGR